jgi:Xaa-Pro aminopeptidase
MMLVAAALSVTLPTLAHASPFSDDLSARRARVMERLGPATMLVLWSAPTVFSAPDVEYDYHQDSNLYYLTGITQPGTILVLLPGNSQHREILFVQERNPAQEHWTGRLLSLDEAKARTGIDTILMAPQFDAFVSAILSQRSFGPITATEASRFLDALSAGRAKLMLALDPNRGANDPVPAPLAFARRLQERFVGFELGDAARVLSDLRLVKTPYEQDLLIKSFDISREAQLAGMQAAHPGAYEYEVKAAIEAVHRRRGAAPSYPSIVGSGPNATILHYPASDRQMQAGDLLLVDAACSLGSMSGDVTRTYPVDGTFTPTQKEIYQIVLQAQEEGAKAARPGASLQDVYAKTVDVVKAGLLRLGLITDASGEQYRLWYTHGSSHYIGIDVHDVGDRARRLEPGMAFTIEPGIYIRQSALDALPRTAENLAFIDKVQSAVRKYEDIGVRIEDSFLLEESGLRNLSAALPKTIADIERTLRGKP